MNEIFFLKQLTGGNIFSTPEDIQKALSVASGFVGINLEPAAKLMLPVYAKIVNRIPQDTPKVGAREVTWRAQLGYGPFKFGSSLGTDFGQKGAEMSGNAVTFQAPYGNQAVGGEVDFQAIFMARGWDDPLAIETARVLSALVVLDELLAVGGNRDALPAPSNVQASVPAAAAGPFGAGTWRVRVTALTLQGCLANTGEVPSSPIGESVPSAEASVTVPTGETRPYISVSWDPVPGALGYKVYVSDEAGSTTLRLVSLDKIAFSNGDPIPQWVRDYGENFVTVNNIRITGVPSSTQPTPPTSDSTANPYVYEGMWAWATKETVYGVSLGNREVINMSGQRLTVSPAGIAEFDRVLASLWRRWQISPTLILASPLTAAAITEALVQANNSFTYRVEIGPERGQFTGGIFVGGYVNKFAANQIPGAATVVPVWAHPYLPDGHILFLTERVPYQFAREARGWAFDTLIPYTYFELGRTRLAIPFQILFTKTLKCYHPNAQRAIVCARVY